MEKGWRGGGEGRGLRRREGKDDEREGESGMEGVEEGREQKGGNSGRAEEGLRRVRE